MPLPRNPSDQNESTALERLSTGSAAAGIKILSGAMVDRVGPAEKHSYFHQGQLVYQWDQTLADITLYVRVPPGARAKDLAVDIQAAKLSFGVRGNPPFLDVSTGHDVTCPTGHQGQRSKFESSMCLQKPLAKRVKPSESFWTLGAGLETAAASNRRADSWL